MPISNIKHYWTILVKNAAITQDNNVILGEVIEEIRYQIPLSEKQKFDEAVKLNGVVAIPFGGSIVTYMECDQNKDSQSFRIEVLMPNGEKPVAGNNNLKLTFGENKRGRILQKIPMLPISTGGKYIFRLVSVENNIDTILAEIPLYVNLDFV